MTRLWFSPAAVKSRHHLRVCKYKKARSRQLYFLRGHCAWIEKQNKSVACVYCIRGATMLLGPVKPSIMPRHLPATKVGVNAALVAPGSPSQQWGEDTGSGGREEWLFVQDGGEGGGGEGWGGGLAQAVTGVGDPWPLWEGAILGDSGARIMNSIKRQAASKAGQNKQQRGDSTRSLSRHEKLSCDFCVPATIVKVPSAYFADIYANAWARGPELALYGSRHASQRTFGNRWKRKKKTQKDKRLWNIPV